MAKPRSELHVSSSGLAQTERMLWCLFAALLSFAVALWCSDSGNKANTPSLSPASELAEWVAKQPISGDGGEAERSQQTKAEAGTMTMKWGTPIYTVSCTSVVSVDFQNLTTCCT